MCQTLFQTKFAVFVTILFFIVVLANFEIYKLGKEKSIQYSKLTQQAEILFQRILPGEAIPQNQSIYAMKKKIEAIKSDSTGQMPEIADILTRWQEVMQAFAVIRTKFYVTIEHFNIGETEIILEGKTANIECFDDFRSELQKLAWIAPKDGTMLTKSENLRKKDKTEDSKLVYQYIYVIKAK